MNISSQVDPNIKDKLRNAVVEASVLEKVLLERKAIIQTIMQQAMKSANIDPKMNDLAVNLQTDTWEVRLKPSILAVPAMDAPKVLRN